MNKISSRKRAYFIQIKSSSEKNIEMYENDFSKHTTENELPRIHMVWDSIPMQLVKKNKKFFFVLPFILADYISYDIIKLQFREYL